MPRGLARHRRSPETVRTILADPGDGRGDQLDPEQVGHQCGKPLFRQQLVVQQIQHECADAFAVLHRRGHPVGECRACLRAAGDAAAAMRAVFGDDQWRRLGQIEHLPGDVIRRHRRGQRFAARGTQLWIMVDGGIGSFRPAQRLARMALLPAGPLARWFPQTADPRRLVQSVAGRWLAAVAAVQPETALQLRQPPCQHRILGAKQRILSTQGRQHRIAASRGCGVFSTGCLVAPCHRHVDLYSAVTCQCPPTSR